MACQRQFESTGSQATGGGEVPRGTRKLCYQRVVFEGQEGTANQFLQNQAWVDMMCRLMYNPSLLLVPYIVLLLCSESKGQIRNGMTDIFQDQYRNQECLEIFRAI